MGKTLVIALGGNALLKPGQRGTAKQHIENLESVAVHIANLHNRGFRIVITHGNGPQVGNILLQQEKARDYAPQMPLYICVAESQALIGSLLQEALYNKLRRMGFRIPVVTIITQVLVDPKDKAFARPTKPIGPTYPTKRGLPRNWKLMRTIKGFRRVVASPRPKEIIEAKEIRRIAREAVVIACGGGGIPVIKERGIKGIDAVIDKDLTAAKLGEVVKAHTLAILTDVDWVYLQYKKPRQKKIQHVSASQLKTWYKQGHFPPGTMGPKIQAALRFLQRGGKCVVITSLNRLEDAINEEWGTIIKK